MSYCLHVSVSQQHLEIDLLRIPFISKFGVAWPNVYTLQPKALKLRETNTTPTSGEVGGAPFLGCWPLVPLSRVLVESFPEQIHTVHEANELMSLGAVFAGEEYKLGPEHVTSDPFSSEFEFHPRSPSVVPKTTPDTVVTLRVGPQTSRTDVSPCCQRNNIKVRNKTKRMLSDYVACIHFGPLKLEDYGEARMNRRRRSRMLKRGMIGSLPIGHGKCSTCLIEAYGVCAIRVHLSPKRLPKTLQAINWAERIIYPLVNESPSAHRRLPLCGSKIGVFTNKGSIVAVKLMPTDTIASETHFLFGVEKPSKMPVESMVSNYSECLPALLAKFLGLHKLYPLHRLDIPTTGIVLLAGSASTAGLCSSITNGNNPLRGDLHCSETASDPARSPLKPVISLPLPMKIDIDSPIRKLYKVLIQVSCARLNSVVTDDQCNCDWFMRSLPFLLQHYMAPGPMLGVTAPRLLSLTRMSERWKLCKTNIRSYKQLRYITGAHPIRQDEATAPLEGSCSQHQGGAAGCVSPRNDRIWENCPVLVAQKSSKFFEVEVALLTGRTHQLRAQFAAMGTPIFGDTTYFPMATALVCGDNVLERSNKHFNYYTLSHSSELDQLRARLTASKTPQGAIGLHASSFMIKDIAKWHAGPPWWRGGMS